MDGTKSYDATRKKFNFGAYRPDLRNDRALKKIASSLPFFAHSFYDVCKTFTLDIEKVGKNGVFN